MDLQDMGLAKWVKVENAYDEFIIVQMKERFNDTFSDEQFKEISPYLQDIADENGLDYYNSESYGKIFNRPKGSWKYPVNESDNDIKKLLKQNGVTKLPSGTVFKADEVKWDKDGGYAGDKILSNIAAQLRDAGWQRVSGSNGVASDGSSSGAESRYVSPDRRIEVTYYSYYDGSSRDNSFGFTFKLAENQVNEADEKEDTFTRSKIPQIYKYYADDVTSVEKFVKKVRDAEQLVENIFIQNDDYYTSMPKEEAWDAFADDMCDGEVPEKALDLDYYMNLAAVDELPEDIKKYVNTSYGSGDFDAVQWLYGIFDRLYPICRDQVDESSRFGFSVGDKVELTKDKVNSISGDVVEAGTQGEVVAVDRPMRGVIKVKIEGGKVISVPERGIKMAGTDNEPWESIAAARPPEPKRDIRPERPEDYYMRPTSYGSPRFTGD